MATEKTGTSLSLTLMFSLTHTCMICRLGPVAGAQHLMDRAGPGPKSPKPNEELVPPAHEHCDAAAHDVEPSSLLLHHARQPARHRRRRPGGASRCPAPRRLEAFEAPRAPLVGSRRHRRPPAPIPGARQLPLLVVHVGHLHCFSQRGCVLALERIAVAMCSRLDCRWCVVVACWWTMEMN